MPPRFKARFAATKQDVHAAQSLRARVFRGQQNGLDSDRFDSKCRHVLIVQDGAGAEPVCVFRFQEFASGKDIANSYAAQYYDLSGLQSYGGKLLELGRFCINPDHSDPDILRTAWGVLASLVEKNDIKMLFGCSSFEGTNADPYLEAFELLRDRYLGPPRWRPEVKAARVFRFGNGPLARVNGAAAKQKHLPPLLNSYLMMGGWVSDHAVIDDDLQTLHVFTSLEISAIPEARKRVLLAVADEPAAG